MNMDIRTVPGVRRPGDEERRCIAAQWAKGTRPKRLRARQIPCVIALVLSLVALTAFLMGKIDAEGVAAIVLAVLMFGAVIILLERQIRSIRRFGQLLEQGAFCLAPAVGVGAVTMRATYDYHGYVDAVLPDGRKINMVKMPYLTVLQIRRSRAKEFPVHLVWPDGEEKPLAFLRELR